MAQQLLAQNNSDDDGQIAAWFNLPSEAAELWMDYEMVVQGFNATQAPHIIEFYRDPFDIEDISSNFLIAATSLVTSVDGFKWRFDVADVFDESDFFVNIDVTYLTRVHLRYTGTSWEGTTDINGSEIHNIDGVPSESAISIKSFALRPVGGAHDTKLLLNWIRAGTTAGARDIFGADYDLGDPFP